MIHRALKSIRQFNSVKRAELADRLGVTSSYLSKIESGKKPISIELLEKYSEEFEISTENIVFFSEIIANRNAISDKLTQIHSEKLLSLVYWFMFYRHESDMKENKKVKQLEFEESFESTEDLIHETCPICGKVTVEEGTVDYCEEISCPFEQIGETHSIPGYSELMFDDDGNYVKNFLGKEK